MNIKYDLITNNPLMISQWNWDKNSIINLDPSKISQGSAKYAHWICSEGHDSFIQIKRRRHGICRVCFDTRNILNENNILYKRCSDCKTTLDIINFKHHSSQCHDCRLEKKRETARAYLKTNEISNKFKNSEFIKERSRKGWERDIKKLYNLLPDQYFEILKNQNSRCLGCHAHKDDLGYNLAVDHDHKTGKIRGLLCKNCNLALGHIKDSTEILNNLLNYLNHSDQNFEESK